MIPDIVPSRPRRAVFGRALLDFVRKDEAE
jgi:hypothetical protein